MQYLAWIVDRAIDAFFGLYQKEEVSFRRINGRGNFVLFQLPLPVGSSIFSFCAAGTISRPRFFVNDNTLMKHVGKNARVENFLEFSLPYQSRIRFPDIGFHPNKARVPHPATERKLKAVKLSAPTIGHGVIGNGIFGNSTPAALQASVIPS